MIIVLIPCSVYVIVLWICNLFYCVNYLLHQMPSLKLMSIFLNGISSRWNWPAMRLEMCQKLTQWIWLKTSFQCAFFLRLVKVSDCVLVDGLVVLYDDHFHYLLNYFFVSLCFWEVIIGENDKKVHSSCRSPLLIYWIRYTVVQNLIKWVVPVCTRNNLMLKLLSVILNYTYKVELLNSANRSGLMQEKLKNIWCITTNIKLNLMRDMQPHLDSADNLKIQWEYLTYQIFQIVAMKRPLKLVLVAKEKPILIWSVWPQNVSFSVYEDGSHMKILLYGLYVRMLHICWYNCTRSYASLFWCFGWENS